MDEAIKAQILLTEADETQDLTTGAGGVKPDDQNSQRNGKLYSGKKTCRYGDAVGETGADGSDE